MKVSMNEFVALDFFEDLTKSIKMDGIKNSNYIPSAKYKPSSMQCIRNMFYYMNSTPVEEQDNPYFLRGIQLSGTDIHVRIQDAVNGMKENGFDCEYVDVGAYVKEHNLDYLEVIGESGNETKIYDTRYNMIFLCDGIIKYKNEYYIIEFKTKGSSKWQKINGVESIHIDQATSYSLALGIDKVMFVYINRDWFGMKTYLIDITEDMRYNIVDKITSCNSYIETQTLPEKPTGVDCTYCLYKNRCEQNAV